MLLISYSPINQFVNDKRAADCMIPGLGFIFGVDMISPGIALFHLDTLTGVDLS